ncbi:sugar ABC transporter substrate-binding protein [Nocardiopsis sp. RSe5-2]|uniref:Sugar ABC transporter substrate-binding protein n=1 Tax=Nocardiopsis endophytica TaxID=3018445 RepID=A0ABT4UC91_9ACTN|nr:sugar ABC transporter substrate-binding protein [Nocardiopsis endophytica]MDA2814600.1 sugar ABC transporter substrate-binding protein [Nocardiopsis endophytica]
MQPRIPRTAAVLTALALTAAGCGGGGGGGDASDGLLVWIMEGTNPDATDYFKEVGERYEEETGTPVEVEFVPWADAHDRFTKGMAGGTLPDVAELGTTFTPEFAQLGALTDLSEQAGDTSAYNEALVEAGTFDGGLYGMPWYAGIRSVIYRTDVFEEHGLEVPENWDELRETAVTISEEEDDMVAFPVPGDAAYSVMPFIWGAGGDIATESGGTWEGGLASPESREGLSFYTDLALEDGVSSTGAATWKETDVQDNFVDGNVAMAISGSWTPRAIEEADPELAENLGAFPIPGPDGGYSPSFLGGSHLGVFEGADTEAAWAYIELLTGDEFAQRWTEESTYFPGKQEQIEALADSDDPLVEPFAVQILEASAVAPVSPKWGEVEGAQVIPGMTQSVLNGDATVDEATQTANTEIEDTLNQD